MIASKVSSLPIAISFSMAWVCFDIWMVVFSVIQVTPLFIASMNVIVFKFLIQKNKQNTLIF